MYSAILKLTRFDRPIGMLLLLWPTLIALWLASNGTPNLNIFCIYTLGVIAMRAAGCAINDYVDRDFDRYVTRTKNRPLASGMLTLAKAKFVILTLLSVALYLALQLHLRTILFAVIGASLVVLYPFAKRFTTMPQLILGLTFSWCIPMVYVELQASIPYTGWLLYLANICWVLGYDTQYALVDKADDLKVGIKSTAITFGKYARSISLLCNLAAIFLFGLVGYLSGLDSSFYWCLLATILVLFRQYQLLQSQNTEQDFHAFLSNNYLGMLIFIGVFVALY